MTFLEKELEKIIWESDNSKLQERDLPIYGKKIRQLKVGNYGVLDLITFKREYYPIYSVQKYRPYLNITVYELKKEKVGISAFLQALRYCKGIKTYLEEYKPNIMFKLNIVLCAKEVDVISDFIYITDLLCAYDFSEFPNGIINDISFYSFTYELDGIKFIKHEGYNLTNKGF